MRKIPILLIGIIITLSFLTSFLFSYAEDDHISLDYDTIIAQEEFYYLFDLPSKVAYDGHRFATYDNGEILIHDDDDVSAFAYADSIDDMLMVGNFIFIKSDYDIIIISLTSGNTIDSNKILSYIDYPKSLTIDYEHNKLYVLGIMEIKAFDITEDDIIYDQEFSVANSSLILESNYISYSDSTLYIHKIANRTICKIPLSTSQAEVFITNVNSDTYEMHTTDNYILTVEKNDNEDKFIKRYDKSGEYIDDILATTSEFRDDKINNLSDISVLGNKIYIADAEYSAIKVFNINQSGLFYSHMYGSYGSGIRRLNNPLSVAATDNNIYIADSLNNRVVKYQLDSNNQVSATPQTIGSYGELDQQFVNPRSIAVDYSSGLYVADSTGRLQFFLRDVFVNTYQFQDICSIAISGNDTVFVADSIEKKIYYKAKSDLEFQDIITLDRTPIDITISKSGSIIYVADSIGISAYSLSGNLMSFSLNFSDYDISTIDSISVDFSGNMYVLSNKIIYRFERSLNDYTLANIFELNDNDFPLGGLGQMKIAQDGRILIANTDYHNVLSISSTDSLAITENNIEFNHPTEIVYPSRIAYTTSKTTIYNNPNNYEDIDTIDKDVAVLVLNEIRYNNINYYYIEYQGNRTYISQNETILLSSGQPSIEYVKSLHPTLDVYLYPSTTAPKVISGIERKEILQVVSNVAERDGVHMCDWYEVEYSNMTGYVLKTEIIPATLPIEQEKKYYAKIKSPQLGEKVNLFALEDSHSAILTTLRDGEKVELIQPLDKDSTYTLIKYEDFSGYVLTENLVESGLTTGQILSIILATVTFCATIAVLVISRVIKREIT